MTGLKSGSGDDLWGDEEDDEGEEAETSDPETTTGVETGTDSDEESSEDATTQATEQLDATDQGSPESDTSSGSDQPYIVRRAIKGKSVQFERDERLTFFVHDDVAKGERELTAEIEAALGQDVPTFDVREAVYRAALANREDVLAELVEMGYSIEE